MSKKLLQSAFVVFAFLVSIPVFAQLAMGLKLNGENYIKFEKIYARLTIKNQSGQAIVFGTNDQLQGKITFQIKTIRGEPPRRIQNPEFKISDTLLKAGEMTSLNIPLSKYFEFLKAGKYRVKAVVSHSQLPKVYETEFVEFNIVDGNVVWSTSAGVPLDEEGTIDKRRYSVISYFDGTHKLFCLLVDDDKHIYGLTKIGLDVGTGKPECEIDNISRLHILLQNSASVYSYFVYNINCRIESKEVYKKIDEFTAPHLFRDEKTGRISVIGGALAIEGRDYISSSKNRSK